VLKSMTGFGMHEHAGQICRIHVEVKSVNNRYGDIVFHMPRGLSPLEDALRKQITGTIQRGRVDVFIDVTRIGASERKINVDKELALAYHKALNDISDALHLPRPDDVYAISQYPEVLCVAEDTPALELYADDVQQTVAIALTALLAMRTAEGDHIYEDLKKRLLALGDMIRQLQTLAPAVVAGYRQRLTDFLESIIGETVDADRILQETAIFADKINFTEEIVRLASHLAQFETAIDKEAGPVGRKLDFIVQEMNREINTVASKANSADIAAVVVAIKSEIEKIREQIQNIE